MSYQVLARKYRPVNFAQLKGQESLVRTLVHAIQRNKIAHAFLLTGTRGVGKTTTARIVAKTINCIDLQQNKHSIEACGHCINCKAYAGENHPDLIEVDAASKTGVNDIREIIENANYVPILAQYKVYIIDEVHMLSNSAFNALLKTLEEPPSYIKFIFATTDPKKIPLTVISRCQRFDLRRLSIVELVTHFKEICSFEKIKYEEAALKLIAMHSYGSVRDGLSLLDQVILHIQDDEKVSIGKVEGLLGITSSILIYQLFNLLVIGNTEQAIIMINELYNKGSEPLSMVEDLLSACNIVAKVQILNDFLQNNHYLSDVECELVSNIAKKINGRSLAILWQMLLKGFEEISKSTYDIQALEMLIIRIGCLADLPTPAEIIASHSDYLVSSNKIPAELLVIKNDDMMVEFKKIIEHFLSNKEMILYHQLKSEVAVVSYSYGKIEAKLQGNIPKDFIAQVVARLNKWTNNKWQFISISDTMKVGQTVIEYDQVISTNKKRDISKHSIVGNVLKAFPGATVENIRNTSIE